MNDAVPPQPAPGRGRRAFLRMLSGGVAIQAILSGSNFLVGLFLVRRTVDAQYGYYVLISTVVLLCVSLQGSFIQPPMIIRLTHADRAERADIIGGLLKDQRRLIPWLLLAALLLGAASSLAGRLDYSLAALLACGTAAIIAALRREFLRMVLFAYQLPGDVLRSDVVYCVMLTGGAFLATLTPQPAAAAALTLALAAVVSTLMLSRSLWRHEPWNRRASAGVLRALAPQGGWSCFGGGTHWLFSQGYNYLVAATLDVTAVAAIAATRLLVMPVGLLSTGIGTLMLPTVSKWNAEHRGDKIFRRLALFASGLAALASCYLLAMWFAREWIFADVLKKSFPQRDLLLLVWSCVALVTVFRDQLLYLLMARARFRATSFITLASAIASFAISFAAMRRLGVIGALIGLLAGELCNVAGIVVLSVLEVRSRPHRLGAA